MHCAMCTIYALYYVYALKGDSSDIAYYILYCSIITEGTALSHKR